LVHDLATHWPIYAAMPLVAGVIGYVTKRVAVEMMFRPLEFKGIPPYLGWQGVIPRSTARMASTAVDLMMGRLLDMQEVIDRIDLDDLAVTLREPLRQMVDAMTHEIMVELQPALWYGLPESGRRAICRRAEESVPVVLDQLLTEMSKDVDAVLDVRLLAINALIRDKALTVKLIRTIGRNEMRFIVRVGFPFGLALGVVQAAVWAATHNTWIMPAFGAATGLLTDWLALQMIFRPIRRTRFGPLSWQGLFHQRRVEVQRDYSNLMAREILTPANILSELLSGPRADRFLTLLRREIETALESRIGLVRPLAALTLGGARWERLKQRVSELILTRLRMRESELSHYATEAFDLPPFLEEKMSLMTDEEFEGLLRPAFKQDEWKLVAVGALLGFLIGELQVHLLLT
jgi:uncharacterized membrane protein YheB (UPF0754 family)